MPIQRKPNESSEQFLARVHGPHFLTMYMLAEEPERFDRYVKAKLARLEYERLSERRERARIGKARN